MDKNLYLETSRCLLVPFEETDTALFHALMNRTQIRKKWRCVWVCVLLKKGLKMISPLCFIGLTFLSKKYDYMTPTQQIFIIISIVGAVQCLFLAFYLWSSKENRHKAMYFLIALLVIYALRMTKWVSFYMP